VTAHEALTASVRRLIDATIRTEVDAAAIAAAKDKIDSATAQLSDTLTPGSFGVRCTPDGQSIAWGNVVIGRRNPVAPPLVIDDGADGVVHTDFALGAAYEGPPGHVHGGVCALILDHVLGATAHQPGKPAYTGTLTVRYLRGTPLGQPLRAQAHVDRIDGTKTFAVGYIADAEGVTVQAEGVFIHPRKSEP
jgi:acyl-coenzyme A thioesterase PaaI-like protein